MAKGGYFTPDLFRFLSDLKAHNEREWFLKNKERFEKSARDPFLRFIEELGPRLKKFSPRFVADPRPTGGSMMRIYRDTRFSKDKTPYKTAVMAHFRHDKGKEGATPAFYIRLAPGESAVGAGIWQPEPGALGRIRDAIVDDSAAWGRITRGREFKTSCGLMGETLKRAPLGFDPAHPFIEDLKRKDFAVSTPLDDKQVLSTKFMDEALGAWKSTVPFLEFLTEAIGLSFQR